MLLAGGVNLVFNLVAARVLHPAAYGALAAIVALVNVVAFAGGAVTRTVTAIVTTLDDRGLAAWMVRRGSLWLALAGAVCAVGGALLAPVADRALHLATPLWVWLAAASTIPAYAGAVTVGVLHALYLWRETGLVNVVAACCKFLVLLALLGAGLGVTGGTLATLTEVTLVWVGSQLVSARALRGEGVRRPAWGPAYREFLGLPVALTVARLLYFNVDVLMARHYLSPREAGLFAALGVTGRLIAYGTGALPPVIYPYLIRYRRDRALSARALGLTLAATAAAGGAVIAVFYLAPAHVARLLFGAGFGSIAPYVARYGLAYLFYSLAYVLLYYLLAARSWWLWAYALLGSAVEVAALAVFHAGIGQFTDVVLAFFGAVFLLSGLHTLRDFARPAWGARPPAPAPA
jgi:O-antigen/teichoic acid export membrane protein